VTGERTATTSNGVVAAAVVGSVLGGLVGGLVLNSLTTLHLPFIGSLAGVGAMPAAFGAWMGLALALGLVFGSVAEPAVGYVTPATSWLTTRLASLRTISDALPRGSAAGGVGLLYGLVAGVAVGLVAVPTAVGGNVPPIEAGPIMAGYAAFGLFLGFGYGVTREGTVSLPSVSFVSPAVRGAVVAPLLAGALSGAIVYAGQSLYLVYLSTIPGYSSLTVGFGIWLGMTFVLGVLFALLSYRHAARGNSTTSYGFVYGIVLAVFVGLLAVPALVSATTRWPFGFGDVGGATLAAFVVYGLTLGSVYGKIINRQPLRPSFLVGRTRATVLSSLVAGAVTAGIVYGAAPVALVLVGYLPGPGTVGAGLATWVGIAVLLGLGFAAFPARRIERHDYPGQTGTKFGLAYGLLVALPVGLFVVPRAVNAVTVGFSTDPLTQGSVLGTYVLLGAFNGIAYSAIRGADRITPVFLQGRDIPVLGGVLVGGGAGVAVAYATSSTPGLYLVVLGSAIGVPSLVGGVAVFAGLALLLGLLFIPIAAQTVETRPGLPRGLLVGAGYGVVLTGLVGVLAVPSVTAIDVPHTNPPVAAYLVYGLLFGAFYGILRRRTLARENVPTSTAVGTRSQRAVVFGSLFGGAVGGLVVHHMVGPRAMLYFSSLVGYGNVSVGWVMWLGICLLLGTAFAVAVGPRLSGYASSMDEFTERDEDLDAVFGDLFEGAPVTTTATVAGFGYGIVIAVAVGAIAFPLAINTITQWGLPMPTLQPFFLLAFVVYGLVMGLGYGVVKEF